MPYRDLHSKPFDETTITKLEIFEDYAEAWIPTFLMQDSIEEIHVFDFFSGPGFDQDGVSGSPLRLLKKINSYLGNFFKTQTRITLHLNEFEPNKRQQSKFELLKKNVNEFLEENPRLNHFTKIEFYNEDVKTLFFNLLPVIKRHPSLVYLDQNGVKFIAPEFITQLEKLNKVDFIYFVSSSYFLRFGETDEFQKVLKLDTKSLRKNSPADIHRTVLEGLRNQLPKNTKLKLFPFSLKKGGNLYGIIFGAKHFRAVDKFLNIAWTRNATNGEADFDIDGDLQPKQLGLFESSKFTKIQKFKNELEESVLQNIVKNNYDALLFAYQRGHIPKHAAETLKIMKSKKLIDYEAKSPCVNYEQVFKNNKNLRFQLKKK